jgi:hypothetical protein
MMVAISLAFFNHSEGCLACPPSYLLYLWIVVIGAFVCIFALDHGKPLLLALAVGVSSFLRFDEFDGEIEVPVTLQGAMEIGEDERPVFVPLIAVPIIQYAFNKQRRLFLHFLAEI